MSVRASAGRGALEARSKLGGAYAGPGPTEIAGTSGTSQYTAMDLRRQLRAVRGSRRDLVMQVWARLNPDPNAQPLSPVIHLQKYVARLVEMALAGSLRSPPMVARERRDEDRRLRRGLARAEKSWA